MWVFEWQYVVQNRHLKPRLLHFGTWNLVWSGFSTCLCWLSTDMNLRDKKKRLAYWLLSWEANWSWPCGKSLWVYYAVHNHLNASLSIVNGQFEKSHLACRLILQGCTDMNWERWFGFLNRFYVTAKVSYSCHVWLSLQSNNSMCTWV